MLNYFKNEKSMYEFALINMDGKKRSEILGVTRAVFMKKEIAQKWYGNIKSKIEDKEAINELEQMYSEMTIDFK